MHMNTCTGCKFKGDCDHAVHLRATLKGHGIRSIKFACAKREPVFRPGDPAIFTTYVTEDDPDDQAVEVRYPGIVIEQKGGIVIGFIKAGAEDLGGEEIPFSPRNNGYVKMPLRRVSPDPSRETVEIKKCHWCASNYAIDGRCDRDPNYTQTSDCLKAQMETAA